MKIEPFTSGGEIYFTVSAEDATDRALLTYFTSQKIREGRVFAMGGHTYESDYHAVTSFNFHWGPDYTKTKTPPKSKAKRRRSK